jgi:hypothetical protein
LLAGGPSLRIARAGVIFNRGLPYSKIESASCFTSMFLFIIARCDSACVKVRFRRNARDFASILKWDRNPGR